MNSSEHGQVLGRLGADEFFDRQPELKRIKALGSLFPLGSGALLLGSPHAGKTELLCRSFDELFWESGSVAPVYFRVSPDAAADPHRFAGEFLATLLSQFVAFRRADPEIIWSASLQPSEVQPLALPEDYSHLRRISESARRAEGSADSLLRVAFRAPAELAAASGLQILLMIDDFHHLITGNIPTLHSEISRALIAKARPPARRDTPIPPPRPLYLLSGLPRLILGILPAEEEFFDRFQLIRISPMADDALDSLISQLGVRSGVHVSDSTRELMIQQLGRDLFYIRALIAAAAARGASLKTFIEFERLYTEELTGGRVGHYLDARLRDAAAVPAYRRAALLAVALALEAGDGIPLDAIRERMVLDKDDAGMLLRRLYDRELLDIGCGFVRSSEDPVLADFIRCRYREEIVGSRPPLAGYELLGEKLKDSYRLMMSRYSRAVESHLVDLLLRFDFQSLPASLLDAADFDDRYGGLSRVQVRRAIDDEQDRVRLPQIAFVSDLGSGEQDGVSWKLVAACGFEGGVYSESNEILWLIALLGSKEPVDVETLDNICRRIDLAPKPVRRGRQYGRGDWGGGRELRWIVSKEGFTRQALSRAAHMQAFRSTYFQLDMIYDYLAAIGSARGARIPVSEFELVIPIEDDAELIAARTVEQIARSADFDTAAVDQIKTALIEACLNAAEHSDSPDRRIYLKFTLTEDGIVIRVANKGNRFEPAGPPAATAVASARRGRGLQIIRALMDDVHFESTDDGASLVMSKYLKRTAT